jgi:TPR repeat protein
MTSTKYYRMMEKLHRPDNSKPGGSAQDDCSHARRLSGGYLPGAVIVAGLVLVFLLKGGLPPSDSQELAWLNRLAAANNPDAQLQLGLACREGRHGLAPDARAGQYWLKRAAAAGNPLAVKSLAEDDK